VREVVRVPLWRKEPRSSSAWLGWPVPMTMPTSTSSTLCSRVQDSHGRTREREHTGVEATAAGQDGDGATANEKMQERTNKNGVCASV
jgi:hypothetical protein